MFPVKEILLLRWQENADTLTSGRKKATTTLNIRIKEMTLQYV